MLKKSLLLTLLMALFIPWAANAQTTVTIGDGTTTNYYTPIGTYYNYSITEQLYTADEIGTAGTISSISFYYSSSDAKDFPLKVYMQNVDAADLSTGISLADADEVFDGTLSVTEAGWATIDLDTPFAYDGTSNLLIGVIKGYVYYYYGYWYHTTTTATMARYTQNDYNPYDTSTVPGTATERPNIQIVITAGSGPVCEKPATMEASNVATTSATLTWTGGSGTYNVEYMGGTVTEWTSYLTNTTATSANLSGLTPGTTYQYRVQSICTEGVSGWKSVSFTTQFGIPFVENFGTSIPTGWSMYTGLLDNVMADPTALQTATYGWSFGAANNVFDNHARCNIYGNYQRWLVLPTLTMEDNVQLSFDLALTVYTSGSNASPTSGAQGDDKFIVLINDGKGWSILREWNNSGSEYVYDEITNAAAGQAVAIDLSDYAGQEITIAFYGESTEAGGDNNLHIDNVSIDYIPDCPKPTNLAVNYTEGVTATVTWEGSATGYELDVNGTTYTTNNNTYSLTSLELATTYEVKVRANCGADVYSDWTNTVSFTTDACLPENKCALTFVVTDSYGDGWGGSSINVYDYTGETVGELLASITNQNLDGIFHNSEPETQTITVSFCDGQELAIVWYSGSSDDDECSYTITDLNGDIVAQDDTDLAMAYTMDCTETDCRRPTDFVASEIGPHSVVLSWTENGPATEWEIAYISENDTAVNYITVNTNPYTLTGLDPETMYGAQVTPVCDMEKPSDVIYWTTDVACPKPSDLTVTPYPTTADVTWTGFGEGYNIEWSEIVPYTPSSNALWLQYDDDTYATSIGNTPAATWTWGVMYPASMLEGNTYLYKVGIYETSYYTMDSYTVNIYTGGDDAPETLVGTQTVIPTGDDLNEIDLPTPVTIDPDQNLWITVTAYGTYVLTACETTEPNNQWVLNGSTWANIGDLASSLAGYGWMIRGFIDNIAPSYDWNTISGVTSPYTITGLEAETDYIVRVQADCDQDGESLWAYATFTTPSACDAPIDLQEEAGATAATLNWTGYQDSFNLKYWIPAHINDFKVSDFEQVGYYTADSVLVEYSIDLSAFSGIGNIAFRHYNITDMFRLNIDDIALTDAGGKEIFNEDFESGAIPSNWMNLDNDGDGNIWGIWEITQQDANGNDVGNGSYCITSASYSGSPLTPDNWLIIPNVELGGTLTFVARGQDPAWAAENFGVYVSTTELVVPASDPVTVNNVTSPYTLTGLTPNTTYEWQVQGVNASCTGGLTEWSESSVFSTLPFVQTVELVGGEWNWFSTYIEASDPTALLEMLKRGMGEDVNAIESVYGMNFFDEDEWLDEFDFLTNEDLFLIEAINDCTIELQGEPVDPASHTITIYAQQWNLIGFPCTEVVNLADAFDDPDFEAVEGDAVEGIEGYVEFDGDEWFDAFDMTPGHGYLYWSASDEDRYLTIQTGSAKTRNASEGKKAFNQKVTKKIGKGDVKRVKCIDFEIK